MKRVTIFAFAVLLTFTASAQQNVVKLGLGSIITPLNRNINLEYERVLNENSTVLGEIGFGIPRDFGSDFINQLERFNVDLSQNNIQITSTILKNNYFIAEYRYFFKGEGARGFYVAPYLKLSNWLIDVEGVYDNNNTGNITIQTTIDANMFATSIGGGIGYQWLIHDQFAINWNFFSIGGGINRFNADFTAEDNGSTLDLFRTEAESFLTQFGLEDNIPLSSDNVSRTISGSGTAVFFNMRASLSLGYAF